MHLHSGSRLRNGSVFWIGSLLSLAVLCLPEGWPGHSVQAAAATVQAVRSTAREPEPAIPSDDVPAPNGPPSLYVCEGTDVYRFVHRISVWDSYTGKWTAITPDLTQVNLEDSPGYGVDGITAGAVGHGAWYVGTLIGNVLVKLPNGTWTYRDDQLPPRTVSAAIILPDDPTGNSAAIGFSGFGTVTPDKPGHVYITHNAGETWTDISGNLPDTPILQLHIGTQNDQRSLLADTGTQWFRLESSNRWVPAAAP